MFEPLISTNLKEHYMLAYPLFLTFPSSVADKYPELEAVSLSVQPQSDITKSFDFRGVQFYRARQIHKQKIKVSTYLP